MNYSIDIFRIKRVTSRYLGLIAIGFMIFACSEQVTPRNENNRHQSDADTPTFDASPNADAETQDATADVETDEDAEETPLSCPDVQVGEERFDCGDTQSGAWWCQYIYGEEPARWDIIAACLRCDRIYRLIPEDLELDPGSGGCREPCPDEGNQWFSGHCTLFCGSTNLREATCNDGRSICPDPEFPQLADACPQETCWGHPAPGEACDPEGSGRWLCLAPATRDCEPLQCSTCENSASWPVDIHEGDGRVCRCTCDDSASTLVSCEWL